jgi:hypothetical protein
MLSVCRSAEYALNMRKDQGAETSKFSLEPEFTGAETRPLLLARTDVSEPSSLLPERSIPTILHPSGATPTIGLTGFQVTEYFSAHTETLASRRKSPPKSRSAGLGSAARFHNAEKETGGLVSTIVLQIKSTSLCSAIEGMFLLPQNAITQLSRNIGSRQLQLGKSFH